MWYEILPSAGIIFAAMALPHFSAYVINKVAFGNVSISCIVIFMIVL